MSASAWNWAGRSILIAASLILQFAIIDRFLPWLPGQILPLAVVIFVATKLATSQAAAVGFVVGLLVDIVPPALDTIGVQAFVFTLVGFGAAHMPDRRGLSFPHATVIAFGLALGAGVLTEALYLALGDHTFTGWAFLSNLLGALFVGLIVGLATRPLGRKPVPAKRKKRTHVSGATQASRWV